MANKYAITGIAMNWSASTWGQIVTGAAWNTGTKVLTPAVSPGWTPDALIGLYVEIRTTTAVLCTVADNDADTLTCNEAGPATGTARYVLFNEVKPAGGDVASANGAVVTMDETPIPASGTVELDSWDTAATPVRNAGQFSIVMTDAIHHDPGSAINTSNLIAGSLSGGLIKTSGAGPADHICTMTADYSIGGIADTRFCFYISHSGGTFWLKNCDVWAGVGGNRAAGFVNLTTSTGIVKLTNVNFHNQITGMAYEGRAPVWELGDKSDYMDWYRGSGPIAVPNTKHGAEPAAGEMLLGVVCGSTTGNLSWPNVADADITEAAAAAFVLSTATFGAANARSGTWVAAANADVLLDVPNGVSPSVGDYYPPNFDSLPGVADANAVLNTAHFGPANVSIGGHNLALWVEIDQVVLEDFVLLGHDRYTGGAAGKFYPPNDGAPFTDDPALVRDTAHYGYDNTTAGTYAGGGAPVPIGAWDSGFVWR